MSINALLGSTNAVLVLAAGVAVLVLVAGVVVAGDTGNASVAVVAVVLVACFATVLPA